jgi:hypothetical protein
MPEVPIVGTQTTRKCVGGPWDGRVVETPATQETMSVPNARPPVGLAPGPLTAEKLLADSTTYELCVLRFPTSRVEVWHPMGTGIALTVARMATGYVPETDLRLILTKVAMLERENESLRAVLAGRPLQPSFDAATTQAP